MNNNSEYGIICVTTNCNFNCDFCALKKQKRFMDWSIYENICNSSDKKLTLNGGEPFTHPDIIKMIDFRLAQTKRITVISNGTYFLKYQKDFERSIKSYPGCDLRIKQSCNYELNRQYKGKLFDHIKKCWEISKNIGLRYKINHIAHKNEITRNMILDLGIPDCDIHYTPLLNSSGMISENLIDRIISKSIAKMITTGRTYYKIDGTICTNVKDNIEYLNSL